MNEGNKVDFFPECIYIPLRSVRYKKNFKEIGNMSAQKDILQVSQRASLDLDKFVAFITCKFSYCEDI